MKKAVKICLKSFIFLLIFVLLFFTAQEILREKTEYTEELLWRYNSYKEELSEGRKIDVLYLGSSPMYAAASPTIMWQEYGFTGMNLATSTQNIISLYYSLLDVLEYSTPQVIVVDFRDLHEARLADSNENIYSYRKTCDTMSSFKLKAEYIKVVMETTGSSDFLFPIVYFHSRWDDLGITDFIPPSGKYDSCTKGALASQKHEVVEPDAVYDSTVAASPYNEISLKYYDKLVALCKEKNITLVGFVAPTADLADSIANYNAIDKYCEENNIKCYNYNKPELIKECGLDFATDFYNNGHVNIEGSVKLSKSLGGYLNEVCDLEDRRQDKAYECWHEDAESFAEKYITEG